MGTLRQVKPITRISQAPACDYEACYGCLDSISSIIRPVWRGYCPDDSRSPDKAAMDCGGALLPHTVRFGSLSRPYITKSYASRAPAAVIVSFHTSKHGNTSASGTSPVFSIIATGGRHPYILSRALWRKALEHGRQRPSRANGKGLQSQVRALLEPRSPAWPMPSAQTTTNAPTAGGERICGLM